MKNNILGQAKGRGMGRFVFWANIDFKCRAFYPNWLKFCAGQQNINGLYILLGSKLSVEIFLRSTFVELL